MSNQAKEWIDPFMQQVAAIQSEASQKIAKATALALEQRLQQFQSSGQSTGSSSTLGTSTGTRGKRGGTTAEHRKAGKLGGKARAAKLHANGTGAENTALT